MNLLETLQAAQQKYDDAVSNAGQIEQHLASEKAASKAASERLRQTNPSASDKDLIKILNERDAINARIEILTETVAIANGGVAEVAVELEAAKAAVAAEEAAKAKEVARVAGEKAIVALHAYLVSSEEQIRKLYADVLANGYAIPRTELSKALLDNQLGGSAPGKALAYAAQAMEQIRSHEEAMKNYPELLRKHEEQLERERLHWELAAKGKLKPAHAGLGVRVFKAEPVMPVMVSTIDERQS